AREEKAVTLGDILLRRTLIGLGPDMGLSAARACAEVAVRHLGWDEERAQAEIAAYEAEVPRRYRPPVLAAHTGKRGDGRIHQRPSVTSGWTWGSPPPRRRPATRRAARSPSSTRGPPAPA